MAIAGLGTFGHSAVQMCKQRGESTETHLNSKFGHALNITDVLLSVTLIVLGVLALLNFVPMPEGWGAAFAYGALGAGTANLLSSFFNGYQSTKALVNDCRKESEETLTNK